MQQVQHLNPCNFNLKILTLVASVVSWHLLMSSTQERIKGHGKWTVRCEIHQSDLHDFQGYGGGCQVLVVSEIAKWVVQLLTKSLGILFFI